MTLTNMGKRSFFALTQRITRALLGLERTMNLFGGRGRGGSGGRGGGGREGGREGGMDDCYTYFIDEIKLYYEQSNDTTIFK